MKVFLSWSGERSRSVALAFKRYIEHVIQGVEVFHADPDIAGGERWNEKLRRELEASHFGILFVTQTNIDTPWILFEAGALSKIDDARIVPVLIGDLRKSQLSDPLAQFKAIRPKKESVLELLHNLNSVREKPLDKRELEDQYEKWWSDFEAELQTASAADDRAEGLRAEYRATLAALRESSAHIERLEKHPLFSRVLVRELAAIQETFRRWGRRRVRVKADRYMDYLRNAYGEARVNIVSTCPWHQIAFWSSDRLGASLLRIQEERIRAGLAITRIFMFNNRSEVTDDHIDAMEQNAKAGIDAKVLIVGDISESWDADLSRHFVSIDDGAVIVSVNDDGKRVISADIFFNDDLRKLNLEQRLEDLLPRCISIDQFRQHRRERYERQWDSLLFSEEIKHLKSQLNDGLSQIPRDSILKNFVKRSLDKTVDRVADLSNGRFALRTELATDEIIDTFCDYVSQLNDTSCRYDTISVPRFWKGMTNEGEDWAYLVANKAAAIEGTSIRRTFILDLDAYPERKVIDDPVLQEILARHYRITIDSEDPEDFKGSIETKIYFSKHHDIESATYPNMAIWRKGSEILLFTPRQARGEQVDHVRFQCFDERVGERFEIRRHKRDIDALQDRFEELWQKSEPLRRSHFQ